MNISLHREQCPGFLAASDACWSHSASSLLSNSVTVSFNISSPPIQVIHLGAKSNFLCPKLSLHFQSSGVCLWKGHQYSLQSTFTSWRAGSGESRNPAFPGGQDGCTFASRDACMHFSQWCEPRIQLDPYSWALEEFFQRVEATTPLSFFHRGLESRPKTCELIFCLCKQK